ncbi:bacteriocin secretion accessory protein, partial [Enterococcus faecalis]|nr:bacteriocin secretion accessory protein [Enterococcus faecalis]
MQQKNWLEHSSIYRQKHNTFYRWVLYPIIFFLCLAGLFLVFAKKEIVIRTSAQLTAEKIEKLQVPIEGKIKLNNLKENQIVKKGEVLVTFETVTLQNEKIQLEQENISIEKQKKAIQMFIDSLIIEQNLFETEDVFGYSNQVNSFLAEKRAAFYAAQHSEAIVQKEQDSYNKVKEQLEKQITMYKEAQLEWEQVRLAWNKEQYLEGFSDEVMSKYQSWVTQLTDVPKEEKTKLKETILVTIDEQITQQKRQIEQLQAELSKLVAPNTAENEINIQKEKEKQNKELTLATAKQKLMELIETQKKNGLALKTIKEQIIKSTLKAPISGTIHLNEEAKGQKELPKGTTLAEVYPQQGDVERTFVAFIPSRESMRIKLGMPVHFRLDKKGVAMKTINGVLTEISENSTTTEEGTFYQVKGILKISREFTSRYGLSGELLLVIGKKTYWQEVKDIVLL